ncbi:unnamed protein product [Rodentolepis nana]|uniref:TRP_2 domain-containing protein n=1 Tax=Rodentolepis nana TaxID=102285 RepID=A0A158QGY5_RODNA|nr:unnamed protein product [Rodentolepis nana]
MPRIFRRLSPASASTEPLCASEQSSTEPLDAKSQLTSLPGKVKHESMQRKTRINDGDSSDPSTHQSDLHSLNELPYTSTRINVSDNIGDSKRTMESFIGSKDNPVFSLTPSDTHTRIATAEGEDDCEAYTVTEIAGTGNEQIVDESTRITTDLVNKRIKRACGKLPKSVATGVLLSTSATRVLFASLSISENADGGGNSGTARTCSISEMMTSVSGKSSKGKLRKRTKVNSSLAPIISDQRGFTVQMGKAKKDTVAGLKLASENGLVFKSQLQDTEYVFLNAAEFGEVEIVKELLNDPTLNVDCVDYMGRNAVLLAMKTENIELIDALVGKLNFYAVEDALLNAISQEKIHIVKLIIDHPQYIRMEKIMAPRGRRAGLIGKAIDRSQFSADITPLMLAAHTNNHEIIQLLLDRGLTLEMPHDRSCMCLDCESIRAQDSLILEMQRLHTYQALTSSAYLALTTSDPVSSAFTLRGELYQLASQEKQFKEEYSRLAVQSMNFAVSCLDLCRTSDEVHSLLTANDIIPDGDTQHHLATIKHAVQCREKKVYSIEFPLAKYDHRL